MRKYLLLGVISTFLCMTVLCYRYISAEPTKSAEEVTKEYLNTRMQVLVTKNVDDIDKYFLTTSDEPKKYMLFNKKYLLEDYLIAYASGNYTVEKVVPEVTIINTNFTNNLATIDATVNCGIHWNLANSTGEPIVGQTSQKHSIVLRNSDNEWKIVSDSFMTSRGHSSETLKEDISKLTDVVEKLKSEAKDAITKAKKSTPGNLKLLSSDASIKKNLKSDSAISNKGVVNVASTTTYNRYGAYNWAYTYYNNYSNNYVNLGDNVGEGGDCTNFTSQCLRAGGASNDKTGSYQWYYDNKNTPTNTSDDSYPWTWSTARGFNYAIRGNYTTNEYGPKGYEINIAGDSNYNNSWGQYLTYGDFIQYEWNSSSGIKHSTIIINMVYNNSTSQYEPVIASHTDNSWNVPWRKSAYKTHFIYMTGIN